MRIDDFLGRLEGVKRSGPGWMARCPAHEDREQSLQVTERSDESIGIFCHAGCDLDTVLSAMNLEPKDLFPPKEEKVVVAEYDYVDEEGNLLYQVVRYSPKGFQQRRPVGDDWEYSLGDVRRVLYRLPEVIEAIKAGTRVWLVEGEKDVEALRKVGEVATTNAGGAQNWRADFTETLKRCRIVLVVADRDGPGLKRAEKLIADLQGGTAKVAGCQAKEGKDAYDHLKAGFGLDEFEPLNPEKKADGLVLERFSEITAEPPEWVEGLEGFIAFKAINLLAGEQGCNKSTFACYLAWLITTKYDADVLYITDEGDPNVELKPRLLAAGADPERCHFVRRFTGGFEGSVFFPIDVRELESEAKRTGARLIIVDPVLAHVDVDDTNNDNSIRTALAPLQKMAQRLSAVVLLIAHINKDRSIDPFKRVGGSKGLTGVARSNLMMGKLYDGHELRAISSFKSSWADPDSSLQLRVDNVWVPEIDGYSIRLLPFGTSNVKASSLLSENRSEQ